MRRPYRKPARAKRRGVSPAAPAETLEARTLLRSFTVTTLSDDAGDRDGVPDGEVSLREALTAANTNAPFGDAPAGDADGDEIAFDAALVAGGAEVLTLGQGQLLVADDVTLSSPERLTLDAADASRHFLVTTGQPVVVERLSLSNGSAEGGGAVRATNADLTLRELSLVRNSAGGGDGGAVLAEGGTLRLEDVGAFVNKARNGGAVATTGTATLVASESVMTGNDAFGRGGAVSSESGNQTLVGVRLGGPEESNTAGTFGGAVAKLGGGTLTVNRSSLINNVAGERGGGVWIQPAGFARDATLRMRAGTLVNANSVTAAGGVGGGVAATLAVVDVAAAEFSVNAAATGGGLYAANAELSLASATFEDNRAGRGGGLAVLNSTGAVSRSVLTRNGSDFSGVTAAGGGAFVTGFLSRIKFGDTIFEENAADSGGGLAVADGGKADLLNGSTVFRNTADAGDGGGVAVLPSARGGELLNVSGSGVFDNAASGRGGGVAVAAGRLTALNSGFTGNTAGGGGGGIDVAGELPSLLRDAVVAGNATLSDDGRYAAGGGVRHDASRGGRLTLANARVENNVGGDGGGIASVAGGLLVVRTNSRVEGNVSRGDITGNRGAGILAEGGTLSLSQTTVVNNRFEDVAGGPATGITEGGGIASADGVVALVNSVVAGGRATFGGGIRAARGRVVLTNSDVGRTADLPGNAAEFYTDGGGIRVGGGGGLHLSGDGSRLTMRQARVVGNEAALRGGGVQLVGAGTVVAQNDTRIAENVVRRPDGSGVSPVRGGGLDAAAAGGDGPTLSFSQTTFAGNEVLSGETAQAHGGGLSVVGGTLALVNSTVQSNRVRAAGYASGGGVFVDGAGVVLQRTTLGGLDAGGNPAGNVAESTAAVSRGGGMDVRSPFDGPPQTARVVASEVRHNEAVSGAAVPPMGPFPSTPGGGGIAVVNTPFVLRGGSVVADNRSAGLGGGLLLSTPSVVLRDSRLERNVVTAFGESGDATAFGGGAFLAPESAELFRMRVEGNRSDRNGGGLAIDGGEVTLTESEVTGNAAAADGLGLGNGGGVFRFAALMTLTDTVIAGNTPDDDFDSPPV